MKLTESQLKIEYIDSKKLEPSPYNPRKWSEEALKGLRASISEFGIVDPFVINKRKGLRLVGGHMRCKVAIELGIEKVPIVYVDLDDKKEKALNVALNSRYISGDWDASLGDLLGEIQADLPDLFDSLNFEDLLVDVPEVEIGGSEGESDADEVPEVTAKPIIRMGDLVILGRHRVLCGDSCKVEDVERLMGGKKADTEWADPPYGIDYSGGRTQVVSHKPYGKIAGDDNPDVSLFVEAAFNTEAKDIWVCCSPVNLAPFLRIFDKHGGVNAVVIWKKPAPGLGYQWIRRYCEFILFWTKRPKSKAESSEFDWWEIATDNSIDYQHGAQKPVELIVRALQFSIGQNVYDPFLGSGSSLIACHQTNRILFGCDIEPRYIQVTTQRWINFAGKQEEVKVIRDGQEYGWGELQSN